MEILLPSASLYGIRTCTSTFGMVDGKITLLVPHVCIFEFPFFYFPVLVSMMYIYSCLYIEKSCSGLHSTKNLLSLVCIF